MPDFAPETVADLATLILRVPVKPEYVEIVRDEITRSATKA